jgi:carbon monoxide dehydrogenase subunit G
VQLEHTFTVPAEIEQAWQVLLDIERIAPCLPGAAIDSVDGDDFTGTVKVRLGPIGLTYQGKASFVEKDAAVHRAVIRAQGKDARGNGTANATVTATLSQQGAETQVVVHTDLNITGKPAQFGRGVMVDVGNKLIGQFADCLAGKLTGNSEPVESSAPAESSEPVEGSVPAESSEPVEGSVPAESSVPVEQPAVPTEQPAVPAEEPPPAEPPAPVPTTPAVGGAAPTRPAHAASAGDVEPIDLLGSAGPALARRLVPLAVLAVVLFVLLRRRR